MSYFLKYKEDPSRPNWDNLSEDMELGEDGQYHQVDGKFIRMGTHFKGEHQFEAGIHLTAEEYWKLYGPGSQIDDFGRDIGSIEKPKRRL